MSGKLKGIRSISTNTLTNPFCVAMNESNKTTVCSYCYSHSMMKGFRKNIVPKHQYNSNLFTENTPITIPKIKDEIFRFNAHGELINIHHLNHLVSIVNANPSTHFALWTKKYALVQEWLKTNKCPQNMTLIYSNPKLDSIMFSPPKGFHKTFNNVTTKHPEENCTGQRCIDCRLCYSHNKTTTIVERLK